MKRISETKVLVTEDDPILLNSIRMNLCSFGLQVFTAETGENALDILKSLSKRKMRPDMMLTDYQVGRMNGIELIRASRKLAPGLKCILMTAFDRYDFQCAKQNHDINDFLVKPFTPDMLFQKIKDVSLEKSRSRGAAPDYPYTIFKGNRIHVGVGDMKVSNDVNAMMSTHSLGSCVGVIVYDPFVKAGGILHYMLPDSSIDPEKARHNPFMFADTGIPVLFKTAYRYGAVKQRMKVIVTGGARILDNENHFSIGKRNVQAARKILWKNNVVIDHEYTGGTRNRTVRLFILNGLTLFKESGREEIAL